MKTMSFPSSLLLIFLFCLLSSCSDDDSENRTCFQDSERQRVSEVTDKKGTIVFLEDACGPQFIIDPDDLLDGNLSGLLETSCDLLPEEFRVEGTKVIFSGFIYETFETEDRCADPFELTDIRMDDQ